MLVLATPKEDENVREQKIDKFLKMKYESHRFDKIKKEASHVFPNNCVTIFNIQSKNRDTKIDNQNVYTKNNFGAPVI